MLRVKKQMMKISACWIFIIMFDNASCKKKMKVNSCFIFIIMVDNISFNKKNKD